MGTMTTPHTLGRLILLRTENASVRHTDLSQWFDELKLDAGFLPSIPRPVDAFKKATSTAEKLVFSAPWRGEGAVAIVRWVDDTHDADRIIRRAERTITIKRKVSAPETVGRVTFYKRSRKAGTTGQGGEKLRFSIDREKISDESMSIYEQWLQDTHSRYLMWLDWIDTDALRGVVRRYLTEKLDGIMIRPGVYFVFDSHADDNQHLSVLVDRFGDECMYHPIELLNTAEHRKMLGAALTSHAEDQAAAIERDMLAVAKRNPRAIPAERLDDLFTKYEHLLTMIHDYSMLGVADGAGAVVRLTETVVNLRPRVAAS